MESKSIVATKLIISATNIIEKFQFNRKRSKRDGKRQFILNFSTKVKSSSLKWVPRLDIMYTSQSSKLRKKWCRYSQRWSETNKEWTLRRQRKEMTQKSAAIDLILNFDFLWRILWLYFKTQSSFNFHLKTLKDICSIF